MAKRKHLLVQRHTWTKDEDDRMLQVVQSMPKVRWAVVAKAMQIEGVVGKQCRERYVSRLNPVLSHDPVTEEEDQRIVELVSMYGTRWAHIATYFQNRSQNQIKNRYYSRLRVQQRTVQAHGQLPVSDRCRRVYCDWTPEEDQMLMSRVGAMPGTPWTQIASELCLPGATAFSCRKRYEYLFGLQQRTPPVTLPAITVQPAYVISQETANQVWSPMATPTGQVPAIGRLWQ